MQPHLESAQFLDHLIAVFDLSLQFGDDGHVVEIYSYALAKDFTAPILTRTWRGGENGVAAKLVARDFDGRANMGASVSICFTSATLCQVLTLMTVLVARSRW